MAQLRREMTAGEFMEWAAFDRVQERRAEKEQKSASRPKRRTKG